MHYPQEWLQGASLGESIACELRLHIINGTVKTRRDHLGEPSRCRLRDEPIAGSGSVENVI